MKYFEIISSNYVIGVCTEYSCEDYFVNPERSFGKITEKQFESYSDNPWERPISKVRYHPKFIFTMGMPHCS